MTIRNTKVTVVRDTVTVGERWSQVWNHHPSADVHPDEYFSLAFQDMVIVNVDYDIALRQVLNVTLRTRHSQTTLTTSKWCCRAFGPQFQV